VRAGLATAERRTVRGAGGLRGFIE